MATLTVTLNLVSNDATGDALNSGNTKAITITTPVSSLSRASIGTAAPTNLLTTAGNPEKTHVYMKNMDATNFIEVKTDAAVVFAQLGPGEFALVPIKGAVGLEVQADTAACVLEYGYWTKG